MRALLMRLLATSLIVTLGCQTWAQDSTKLAMPDNNARTKARAEVNEIFDLDKQRSVVQKRALITELLAAAKQLDLDPAARFVLLNIARETAADIGDIDTALATIDDLETKFAIDSFAAQLHSIRQAGKSSNLNARRSVGVLTKGRELMRQYFAAGDFPRAKELGKVLQSIAKKFGNTTVVNSLQDQMQKIDFAMKEQQAVAKARIVLEQSPNDPASNELVGRHTLASTQNWNEALPLLAKAATASIASAAQSELNATSGKNKLDAGKAWLAIANTNQDPMLNSILRSHALTVFRDARTSLKGLSLIVVKKEIDALEKAGIKADPPVQPTQDRPAKMANTPLVSKTPPKVVAAEPVVSKPITGAGLIMDDIVDLRWAEFDSIDVLKAIDVERHAIRSKWSKNANVLTSSRGKFIRIRTPFVFPEQYDLFVKCKPVSGATNLVFSLPTSIGHRFVLQLDAYLPEYQTSGLETIEGKNAKANLTRYKGDVLQNGRPSRIHVSVRRTHIAVNVDGKNIIQYSGPQDVLSDRVASTWFDKLDMVPLIGAYDSAIEIHSMILKSFTDELSDSRRQPVDSKFFSRFGNASIPSRIANARKVFLDEIPEAAFTVAIGTLGKRGRKGHGGRGQVYLGQRPVQHALSMHPHSYGSAHVLYRLDGIYKTLTVQPGIAEDSPGKKRFKSKSKLRFSIYGDGKQLANVNKVQSSGIADNLTVNVTGVNNLLLIVQCPTGSSGAAHAVWGNPILEK